MFGAAVKNDLSGGGTGAAGGLRSERRPDERRCVRRLWLQISTHLSFDGVSGRTPKLELVSAPKPTPTPKYNLCLAPKESACEDAGSFQHHTDEGVVPL